jgi:hypothetical protein
MLHVKKITAVRNGCAELTALSFCQFLSDWRSMTKTLVFRVVGVGGFSSFLGYAEAPSIPCSWFIQYHLWGPTKDLISSNYPRHPQALLDPEALRFS